jgi:hypothetical protein
MPEFIKESSLFWPTQHSKKNAEADLILILQNKHIFQRTKLRYLYP